MVYIWKLCKIYFICIKKQTKEQKTMRFFKHFVQLEVFSALCVCVSVVFECVFVCVCFYCIFDGLQTTPLSENPWLNICYKLKPDMGVSWRFN